LLKEETSRKRIHKVLDSFSLHGADIDQQTNPLQADLTWVLSPDKKSYVGSETISYLRTKALDAIRRGVIVERGIPRQGFDVLLGSDSVGKVTSGTFSPILRKGIALCRLKPEGTAPGTKVRVAIRDSAQDGQTVKPPFYDERLYGWKRQGNGN
jgi:aminomethyltransferase